VTAPPERSPQLSLFGWGVAAYLLFAVNAGWSERPDGSTRWPVAVLGAAALAASVLLLVGDAVSPRARRRWVRR
jgi:hypothetical protein